MSRNRSTTALTVAELGQVVTQGLILYRNHWRAYSLLALKAFGMQGIPIVGWPYYSAYKGAILRHGLAQLSNESLSLKQAEGDARRQRSKLFRLSLGMFWAVLWRTALLFSVLFIVFAFLLGFLSIWWPDVFENRVVEIAAGTIFMAVLLLSPFWFYRRLLYAESISLTQPEQSIRQSIRQSQSWSRADRGQLVGFTVCMFCLTIPVAGFAYLTAVLIRLLDSNFTSGLELSNLIWLPQIVAGTALMANSPVLVITGLALAYGSDLANATQWRWWITVITQVACFSGLTAVVSACWQTTKAALHHKAAIKYEGVDLQSRLRRSTADTSVSPAPQP